MQNILDNYAASTGLHINYTKSSLIPINISNDRALTIATLLDCKIGVMPFTYLGLPVGTTKPTVQDMMPLVDRVERKMSANVMMMAYSGRVTVINSLITSIAMFSMCSLEIPPKILEHLEKIRKHILWDKKTEDGVKTNYLVAWDRVCMPKKRGGIGVLNLKIQNEALLLKFLDKFYNKVDTPWVTLVWNAYYTEKVPHAIDPCGSFWWRSVLKLCPIFRGIAKCSVGNGNSVLFWKDNWTDKPASDIYLRAFSFCKDEDISVRKFLGANTLAENFNLPLSPEAMAEVRSLQQDSLSLTLQSNDKDEWIYPWGNHYTSSKY